MARADGAIARLEIGLRAVARQTNDALHVKRANLAVDGSSCPSPARLCDADAGYRDLLEQVRRGDGRGRISGELRPELGMRERSPEVCSRFPDGIVQVG